MDPELERAPGRAAAQDLLDEKLAEWTRAFDDYELFHRLQRAGVPAAPVLEASRLLDDPHVQARNLLQPQELEDDIGVYRYPGPLYEFPESPGGIRRPPVAMGQDNDYVYKELLGIDEQEYQRLVGAGHIARAFHESVP